MEDKKAWNWVVFCHLGGLITVSFLDFIIPLVIWLTKRNDSCFIDEQGKEIVNFQISLSIYFIVCFFFGILSFGIGLVIVIPIMIALAFVNLISIIIGAIKTSSGEKFLYPINLRLVK